MKTWPVEETRLQSLIGAYKGSHLFMKDWILLLWGQKMKGETKQKNNSMPHISVDTFLFGLTAVIKQKICQKRTPVHATFGISIRVGCIDHRQGTSSASGCDGAARGWLVYSSTTEKWVWGLVNLGPYNGRHHQLYILHGLNKPTVSPVLRWSNAPKPGTQWIWYDHVAMG